MTLFKIAFVFLLLSGFILTISELWKQALPAKRYNFLVKSFRVLLCMAAAFLILSVIVSLF